MTLRVLIADDEPPARDRLRAMLASHAEVEVIAEVGDGRTAVDAILEQRPDLLFLDIKMPELSGVEVVELLSTEDVVPPAIVFVTAYDSYALKAFDVGAVDYLLKPFDQERFDRTLRSAVERIAARRLLAPAQVLPAAVSTLLRDLDASRVHAKRLLVRRGRQMQFVKTDDVDWMEAQGNYIQLHIGGRAHLLRETMSSLEARLDPAQFVRVHRSAIVNIDRVDHIEPYLHGEYTITMRGGGRLTTSAAHSGKLRSLLR
jgi:two-component system LytT family response regulator